jgi:hypothetical protein
MGKSTWRESVGRGAEPKANVLEHWNPSNRYANIEQSEDTKLNDRRQQTVLREDVERIHKLLRWKTHYP